MTHRAVPTSQIAQNIENINHRNIADTSQLDALTRSDHTHKVDNIRALTASKCIDYIILSYPSPFPAFATCFSCRQSTLSVYSLFWISRLQYYILLVIPLVTHCFPLFLKVAYSKLHLYIREYISHNNKKANHSTQFSPKISKLQILCSSHRLPHFPQSYMSTAL